MPIQKLLPGNETILLLPATEILGVPHILGVDSAVSFAAPTKAVLDKYIAITGRASSGSGSGGNISCAVRDDANLGLSDSDTDDDRSICSVGQSQDLTFYNFDAELNSFRDADLVDTASTYNLFRDLTRAPDVPYIIAHRIGAKQTAPVTIGEEWDFYYAWTDNPIPGYGDGDNQTIGATFVPKNLVNIAYAIAA